MYSPPTLPFFIKNVPLNLTICYIYLSVLSPETTIFHENCPLKLHNLLYIFICIVPLNYHFSYKKIPP